MYAFSAEVKSAGAQIHVAAIDMAEVTEYLYNQERSGRVIIDDALKAAIDAYYEQYGAKE